MRTIKRYLRRAFADPGSAASVIVGVLVGALVGGGAYESRAPTHTAPARRDGVYEGDRDD
jgi:hypothetical protein